MSDHALLVDKTLGQCRQSNLKKFEVRTWYDIRFESRYRDWIRYAIIRNVENLNLEVLGTEVGFVLDQSFFINSCFIDVRLSGWKLSPTRAISWGNLRKLCLSRVNVDQDLIVNIVYGSPLFKNLVLHCCEWPNITSESESESEDHIIGISAPSLSLTQCRQLMLKKLEVCTRYDIKLQSLLNDLICYAIRCNVKNVDLELWDMESKYEFMVDPIFFTSSCFTKLAFNRCMLDPVGAISWKSLRRLCISDYQSLDEDLIENILSGSPVLETLLLYDCYGYRRIDITSKSVKNLLVSGYKDAYGEYEDDIIEINAPNILSLTIKERLMLRKLLLLNVSSLVTAKINYTCSKVEDWEKTRKEEEQETVKENIMNLGHVKELEIGFLCYKAISCLQAKGFVLPSNVKFMGDC